MSRIHSQRAAPLIFLPGKACLLLLMACAPGNAQEKLDATARKEILNWMNTAQDACDRNNEARFRKAETALRAACVNETKAMELYMDSMKNAFSRPNSPTRLFMRIAARQKKNKDGHGQDTPSSSPSALFSSWRKSNQEINSRKGMKKALLFQLQWMLLGLQQTRAERMGQPGDLSPSILNLLNDVMGQIDLVGDYTDASGGAANAVRNALGIDDLKPENLPDSVFDISGIYERVLLPPFKKSKNLEGFRNMWDKRITDELKLLVVIFADKRSTLKDNAADIQAIRLKRQMEKEKECFLLGDEVRATENFRKIIASMTGMGDKREALKIMKNLLTPNVSGKK